MDGVSKGFDRVVCDGSHCGLEGRGKGPDQGNGGSIKLWQWNRRLFYRVLRPAVRRAEKRTGCWWESFYLAQIWPGVVVERRSFSLVIILWLPRPLVQIGTNEIAIVLVLPTFRSSSCHHLFCQIFDLGSLHQEAMHMTSSKLLLWGSLERGQRVQHSSARQQEEKH